MKKPITVTAGHSDVDPGAIYNNVSEGPLVRDLREQVAARLRLRGCTVRTDGTGLVNLPLVEAMRVGWGSGVAVEFHTNASENILATGVEVFAAPAQKQKAQRLASIIASVLRIPLRGDLGYQNEAQSARGRLGFVRMGGMVVELFFLSNTADYGKYENSKGSLADAIAKCLVDISS